ncbi:hypothetical protein BS78_10G043100 [Paspalum vaginatum]|nr:hypothetical protein BS78_10G043100 [Paspalum vaginatum]
MLRLRKCILSRLLSPPSPCTPSTTPIVPLHRLLSATATPFAVEDYLVARCHLTPAQALKASKALSHLKSPSKPDAVLAFLSGSSLGLSDADIATIIAKDPKLLCSGVERTLSPCLAEFQNVGLSPSQITRLVLLNPRHFRLPTVVAKLQYYFPLFGSFENLLRALRGNSYLLYSNLERVVKPNVAFLMECGLDARDITRLSRSVPRLITSNTERVHAMVELAESVGVPRGTRMFKHALEVVAFLSKEKIIAKLKFLKRTFGWSDADVDVAVSKMPIVLLLSKERLCCKSEFLITQFLKENGLLEHDRSYYTAVYVRENVFMGKFIHPYKEAAPTLAQDYAAACRGEVPNTFRSQELSTG